MSKILRKTALLFAQSSGFEQVAQFGSFAASSPMYSLDPAVIQALSNYLDGWFAAVDGENSPCIEDMNALCYLFSYQICYAFQAGVPEWDSGTTYFTNSVVQSGGVLYISLIDNNLNNAVTVTADWKVLAQNVFANLGDLAYSLANGVPAQLAGNITTTKQYLSQTGTGAASAAPAWSNFKGPTATILTTGSGTYTPPAGVVWLRIRMAGGGAGGNGGGASFGVGTAGTATTFGTSLLTAGFGSPGAGGGGGAGGTNTVVATAGLIVLVNQAGQNGGGQNGQATALGAPGGNNPLFGGGGAAAGDSGAGGAATTNTGGGGGGGSSAAGGTSAPAGGGGGGIEALITTVATSYAYSIGNGGTAGSGSSTTGGVGAKGQIIIEEMYQ